MANFNNTVYSAGHVISGITCNNNKYVYNGWSSFSNDPAIVNKDTINNLLSPCSLMKFDWDVNKDEEFCLNAEKCKLDFVIDKKDLCFSFNKGERLLIYVKIDDKQSDIKSTTTKNVKQLSNMKDILDNINNIDKLKDNELVELFKYLEEHIDINRSYLDKPKDELKEYLKNALVLYYYYFDNYTKLNKLSDRYLTHLLLIIDKITGSNEFLNYYGKDKKKIIAYLNAFFKNKNISSSSSLKIKVDDKKKSPNPKKIIPIANDCPDGQIRNPKTKRCVSKKGKIGLEILKNII